jgi:transcriptional regulator with XRE-family HTH domain
MRSTATRMADPDHRIASEIRAARAYAGMSRKQVGDAIGVSPWTIGNWERGEWEDQPPRIAMLEAIARACQIPDVWQAAGFLAEPDSITPLEALVRVQQLLLTLSSAGPGEPHSEESRGLGGGGAAS